jgi:hypothetical protein
VSDARFAADVFAGLMNDIEAYADAFERTARTPEQKELAKGFRELVGDMPRLIRIAAKHDPPEKVYAVEHLPDGRSVVWNMRDMEPENIFSNEAAARECAETLNSTLHHQEQQRRQGKEASSTKAGELSAALFGGSDPHTESPAIQKESPPHDPLLREDGGRSR